MPVKKVTSSSRQPRSLARQRKRPASAKADSDTLQLKLESKARGVRRQPPSATKTTSLSIPVYSLLGRSSGTLSLPKEIFGQEVNKNLLTQALRVYMTNKKSFTASTKTRGEVRGSTAKIYRQKGTGRARHGAIRAPIFVGGGIVFGPKPRKVSLELPKKMRRKALISALSAKMVDKKVIGLAGLDKATGKTKQLAQLLDKIFGKSKKISSTLIITEEKTDNVIRAVRNIPQIDLLPANLINAYEVLRHDMLMLTKNAVEKLSQKKEKI